MTTASTEVGVPAVVAPEMGLRQHARDYVGRLRGGDMGALPAVLGLVALCTIFAIQSPAFMTAGNFANLFTQGAAVTLIAMGLTFVLLLGEIDLSAGFTSGVCAAVLAVALTHRNVSWPIAITAALVTGALIGLLIGILVSKVGIPSFVVTLAAFLAFQGVLLLIVKNGTSVSIRDSVILAVANNDLPSVGGWALFVLATAGYAGMHLIRIRRRAARALPTEPLTLVATKVAALAAMLGAAVYVLNLERSRNPLYASLHGVPIVVPVMGVLLVVWTFVLTSTRFGRHIYAVGGNREAARRAGINVDRIRIAAFVICSGMAAIGGVVAASRANSVDPNTGGSKVLLYAVGAAVIGGTSLFGGKGRVLDAVLGGAVVTVIENGMGLLGLSSGVQFVATGSVLLLAAGVDALSRRRAAASGLR